MESSLSEREYEVKKKGIEGLWAGVVLKFGRASERASEDKINESGTGGGMGGGGLAGDDSNNVAMPFWRVYFPLLYLAV